MKPNISNYRIDEIHAVQNLVLTFYAMTSY